VVLLRALGCVCWFAVFLCRPLCICLFGFIGSVLVLLFKSSSFVIDFAVQKVFEK
jgi:hypothetical protein